LLRRWDDAVVDFFDRHYYDLTTLRDVAEVLVYLGLAVGAAIALLFLVALLRHGLRRQALFWALAIGGAAVLTLLLKELIQRPQIGDPDGGYSFPSGNATGSVAFVTALFLLLPALRRKVLAGVAAIVLLATYGAALVLLLWHYPSDVVSGWCIAIAWVGGTWIALGGPVVSDSAKGLGFTRSVEG
jgi:undecaprenyl-diphosphatase